MKSPTTSVIIYPASRSKVLGKIVLYILYPSWKDIFSVLMIEYC